MGIVLMCRHTIQLSLLVKKTQDRFRFWVLLGQLPIRTASDARYPDMRTLENCGEEKKCLGQRYGIVPQFGLPSRTTHKDQKACSICKCPGHQPGSCPKIHKFNKPPLDMNKDMLSRHELSRALSKVGRYKTDYLPLNNKPPMSSSTPLGPL